MLTHEVKRPWWAWLWRDRISVAITSAEVRCTSGNETDSIAIAAIDLVKVSRRWYGTRLTFSNPRPAGPRQVATSKPQRCTADSFASGWSSARTRLQGR